MPAFVIRTVNSIFEADGYEMEAESVEAAMTCGVDGAIMIAAEEARSGAAVCSVEVIIEDERGSEVSRSVVSLCVAPLLARSRSNTSVSGHKTADRTRGSERPLG